MGTPGNRAVLVLLTALLLPGCATRIVPARHLQDPVTVAVIDHGRHSTLVLSLDDGRIVRYGYGDWSFYALAEEGVIEATPALLWPTRGALGRKVLPGPLTEENLRARLKVVAFEIFFLPVEKERAAAFLEAMERLFFAGREHTHFNSAYDLAFVSHPDSYWMFHNSNQVLAGWLEALGCEVKGSALFSRWSLE